MRKDQNIQATVATVKSALKTTLGVLLIVAMLCAAVMVCNLMERRAYERALAEVQAKNYVDTRGMPPVNSVRSPSGQVPASDDLPIA